MPDTERSDMNWVAMKLSSEVAAWNAYKERVQKWQCASALEKNAKMADIERKHGLLIESEVDLRCPCTDVQREETLGVHLQSCAQAWREVYWVAASDVIQVY